MSSKVINNPEYVGPGIWYTMHSMAYYAQNPPDAFRFAQWIRWLSITFPCLTCREHFQLYLKNNPIDLSNQEYYKGRRISLFKWTWKFHNTVNRRLNKPIVTWEAAYKPYDEPDATCHENCKAAP